MQTQMNRILRAVLTVLFLTASIMGQPLQSHETQIRDKRLAVRTMVDTAPAADAQDAPDYNRRVATLRNELLRLLLKKTGSLESRIQNLEVASADTLVREQIDQLTKELENTESEITEIDRLLSQTGTPAPVVSRAVPANDGDNRSTGSKTGSKLDPKREEERKLFNATVASITPEALAAAALPAAVNSAPPVCNERGRPAVVPYSRLDEALCRLGSDLGKNNRTIDLENDEANILTILIAKLLKTNVDGAESYSAFVTDAQEIRTDQQMGAGPTSNTSTSLVSKGGIPYLFGLAVENGAAEQFQNDTALTFRFNPGGVINMFSGKGFITGLQSTEDDPVMKFLRKTSIGLTFDTSRGDTPGTFLGNRQQLSQVQARVEFVNERDPRHKRYLSHWENFVANEGVKLAQQTWKTTVTLTDWTGDGDITFSDPALQAWLIKTQQKIADVEAGLVGVERINGIAKVISEQADQLPVKLVSKKALEAITEFAKENKAYIERKNELLDRIARGKLFTLEYTNKREVNASDTSSFNLIAATGTRGRVDLTANGSFTFFHKRPPALSLTSPRPSSFRDFQFAGQVTVPLKSGFDFWFSGRYERLLENAQTLAGTIIPDTKGDIAFGQFGLNIPISSLGIKFPVSFTFANRTELVKEKEIRGNFGFTFNWDTLFSKLKPF